MHFKSLELFGFKSFAEKTELFFEPGVTAIVGPNGCGKSNISDAIKWVLGENSARELRGLRMEDVIFNGTDGKEALGFAEVSLTISNQPKFLPTEYDEVTITRRVFRSGESDFFINKTPVRLKDIAELFMGTGIGTATYSLMEQGKIDQILDSRPEERRYVFEEAAGITKYKSQKKEALRKLEQTEANLLRVDDVIVEVRRQINSIERQANKARRYKEEFEKLKELEVLAAGYEYKKMSREEEAVLFDKERLAAKESEMVAAMDGLGVKLDVTREKLFKVDQRLSDAKANIVDVEGQIQRNSDRLLYNSERTSELLLRITLLEKEAAASRERVSALEGEVSKLKAEVNSFKSNEESKRSAVEEKTRYLDEIAEVIKTAESNIEQAKTYFVDIAQGQAKLRNELAKLTADCQNLSARQRRIEVEKRKVGEERDACGLNLKGVNEITESLFKTIEGLNWRKAQAEGALSGLDEDVLNLEAEARSLNAELTTAQSRLGLLEDLKSKYEGFSRGVKSVLKELEDGSSVSEGVVGILAELLEPLQGYDAAVEAALGENVEAVIVRDRQTAKRLIKFLCDNSLGRASFVVLEDLPATAKSDILDYVKVGDEARRALEYLLKDVYLTEDLERAFKGVTEGEARTVYVTKNAEVVKRGFVAGGAMPRAEGFGLIGRDAKLKELKARIEALAQKAAALDKEACEKRGQRDALQLDAKSVSEEIHKAQLEHANRLSESSAIEKTISRLSEEGSLLNFELDEVGSEVEELTAKEKELKGELASLDEEDAKIQETIKVNEETISLKAGERQEVLVQVAQIKTELDLLQEREASVLKALEMMSRSLEDERNGLLSKEREIAESRSKIDALGGESEGLMEKNELFGADRKAAQQDAQNILTERKQISDFVCRLENQIREAQKQLDDLRGEINLLALKTTEFGYKKGGIKEKLLQVYRVELEPDKISFPEDTDCDGVNAKLQQLRSKLEQIGPVNLVAIEEHEELEERFNFLTGQQGDLLKAKEDLHKAINKINRTTRELFVETFQKIQVEFRNMFRLLFGGGDAELLLIDESDILESGIEIIARPPGKKPQSISLLSGGERSLTATSLLFAIFKVKPSPFCVLDEIDAALDEANIDRFCRVLKEFVRESQFIMITHNKKTISMADVMYGITMEESGVSKIVSVKFAHESDKVACQGAA